MNTKNTSASDEPNLATLPPVQGRSTRNAAALSLLLPGLGHVYCGQLRRGLALMVAGTVLVLALLLPLALDLGFKPAALIGTALLSLGLYLYAVVDSAKTARQVSPAFTPQGFNHWTVYAALFLLAGCSGPLAAGLFVREKFLQPFRIPTDSMAPTLLPGDRMLAVKNHYRNQEPKRGDLVIFPYPDNRRQIYVKRVVALGGDTVEVRQGHLWINGTALPLDSLSDGQNLFEEKNGDVVYRVRIDPLAETPTDAGPLVVAPNHVFVLGDNRLHSKDSREFGAIATSSLLGRVGYLYWPSQSWDRFGEVH